jgi:hypothetical protein
MCGVENGGRRCVEVISVLGSENSFRVFVRPDFFLVLRDGKVRISGDAT